MEKGTEAAARVISGDDGVRWREVAAFVGITFGLTWLLDLFVWLMVGLDSPSVYLLLQLQMLIPGSVAIFLGTFFFPESRIHIRRLLGRARGFLVFFLVFAMAYLLLGLAGVLLPGLVPLFNLVGVALAALGLLMVLLLRAFKGRESFARAGLAGGKVKPWLLFALGLVLFYALQTLLNYLFNMGQRPDLTLAARQSGLRPEALIALSFVQSSLLGPFLGLLFAFGEEYGWRGYLQGELVKLGRIRGILLVGLIWGIWHAPIILMGYNYPGYPLAGTVAMVFYSTGLAFVLGYAVLKTGSIWLAAYLHALNNQVYSFLVATVYTPLDPLFSFGLGIYGIAVLALVVAVILRDPVWRGPGSAPAVLEEKAVEEVKAVKEVEEEEDDPWAKVDWASMREEDDEAKDR